MRILDLSAGNRAIWFDKKYPCTTFIDIRPEVKPDIVADSRSLPSGLENYNLIVFDPPHVNFGANADLSRQYGYHTTTEIRSIVKDTAAEAYRVSAPDALMALKWNDHDQKLETILALVDPWWEPLFGHKVASRTKHSSSTQWVLLKRRHSVKEPEDLRALI